MSRIPLVRPTLDSLAERFDVHDDFLKIELQDLIDEYSPAPVIYFRDDPKKNFEADVWRRCKKIWKAQLPTCNRSRKEFFRLILDLVKARCHNRFQGARGYELRVHGTDAEKQRIAETDARLVSSEDGSDSSESEWQSSEGDGDSSSDDRAGRARRRRRARPHQRGRSSQIARVRGDQSRCSNAAGSMPAARSSGSPLKARSTNFGSLAMRPKNNNRVPAVAMTAGSPPGTRYDVVDTPPNHAISEGSTSAKCYENGQPYGMDSISRLNGGNGGQSTNPTSADDVVMAIDVDEAPSKGTQNPAATTCSRLHSGNPTMHNLEAPEHGFGAYSHASVPLTSAALALVVQTQRAASRTPSVIIDEVTTSNASWRHRRTEEWALYQGWVANEVGFDRCGFGDHAAYPRHGFMSSVEDREDRVVGLCLGMLAYSSTEATQPTH